jgi:hypothetical protein
MPSSGILRRVALERTDVSDERSASIIRVTRIGELGATSSSVSRLLVTHNFIPSWPILISLMMEVLRSSETSVPRRATRRNIREVGIFSAYEKHVSLYIVTCLVECRRCYDTES